MLGSAAVMSRGKWSLWCRKRQVEHGTSQAKCSLRKDTAGICKFIRETLEREGDHLQDTHEKQWSPEALNPLKCQRIKIPFRFLTRSMMCNVMPEVARARVEWPWRALSHAPGTVGCADTCLEAAGSGRMKGCPGCHHVLWLVCTITLLYRTGESCRC